MKKVLLSAMIFASVLHAETLQEAAALAYQNNPELLAKLYHQLGQQEATTQAWSSFLPTVNAEARTALTKSHTHDRSRAGQDNPPSSKSALDQSDQSLKLTINQNLFKGFGDVSGLRAARHEVDAGYYNYRQTEQKIILAAVEAYTSVWLAQKTLAFQEENEKFLRKQLDAIVLARDAGEKTTVDVSHAKAALAEAQAERIEAQGRRATAHANYENVVGQPPEGLIYPTDLPQKPETREQFLTLVQIHNPRIRQAQHLARRARHTIGTHRAKLLPSLDLHGELAHHSDDKNYAAQGDKPETHNAQRNNSGLVALQLHIPLYSGGANMSQVRQANHEAVSARFQLDQVGREVLEEATQAWEKLLIAEGSIAHRREHVAFSQISRDGAFLSVEAGAASYLDALDAQNNLLKAQKAQAEAEANLVTLRWTLPSFVGTLSAGDLQENIQHRGLKQPRKPQQGAPAHEPRA